MTTPPRTPLRGTQNAPAAVESASTPSPQSKFYMKWGLRMWASSAREILDRDEILAVLEHGVDRIYCMRDAIERAGKEELAKVFESLKRLPQEERSNILGEIIDTLPTEDHPRSPWSFQTPVKRSFAEMSTRSSSPSSSPSKRFKTSPPSNSSNRTLYYCPKCHERMANKFKPHLSEHLHELCPSRSPSSENLLIGCGYCRPEGRNTYYGQAFFGPQDLIDHITKAHSLHPIEHGWDINNAINNILTHKVFVASYNDLRHNKRAPTTSTSLHWTPSTETQTLLQKLQELGGRSKETTTSSTAPNPFDQDTAAQLLETAYALAEVYDLRLQDTTASDNSWLRTDNASWNMEDLYDDQSFLNLQLSPPSIPNTGTDGSSGV